MVFRQQKFESCENAVYPLPRPARQTWGHHWINCTQKCGRLGHRSGQVIVHRKSSTQATRAQMIHRLRKVGSASWLTVLFQIGGSASDPS
jgi:hypothetical protein